MNKIYTKMITVFLLSLIGLVGIATWPNDAIIDTYQNTLTVISSGRDSTSVWVVHKNMTVSIGPGYSSSSPDSFNTANNDSTGCDVYARFYADKQRKVMVGQIQLFDPFQMQIAPTTTNFDSASAAITLWNPTATAIVAGTGDYDSSMVYLNDLVNYQKAKAYSKYFDILMNDSDDTCPYTGSMYDIIVTYSDF